MRPDTGEWLETDGLGGFASGTVAGPRTRRYHALLLAAARPPVGRFVLVNGCDVEVEGPGGPVPLSSQMYAPGVVHPAGVSRIVAFRHAPWPHWTFRLPDGALIEQEIFVPRGTPDVVLAWRLAAGAAPRRLVVRPFLSGRDYHALHHENGAFRFAPEAADGRLIFRPYPGVPSIVALSNGAFAARPDWYRSFLYEEERARGLDCVEDLAMPGTFTFDPARGEAVLILRAGDAAAGDAPRGDTAAGDAAAVAAALRDAERRRRAAFPTPLHRAADAYIVRRDGGATILAGYPWFTDWGRDTFIALRGLCLSAGRTAEARSILLEWAGAVSEGMLPNRFPDAGDAPEYNSVDASLWYVVAVGDYLAALAAAGRPLPAADRARLAGAVEAILDGYARGTRYGIALDADGLLRAGAPGVQLTWMDARVGDRVVTPRAGKPVEVQALWLNALHAAASLGLRRDALLRRGRAAFVRRFWNEAGGYLHDVVDPDHRPGEADATFRPNQILAIGGLPLALLAGPRARRVVDAVEERLYTPLGLRSLAPGEPGYTPRYEGGVPERDGAYHQGTVWPWLLGPFVEAWLRVRRNGAAARRAARARFLQPLLRHLDEAGLGHVSEIADAEPPHDPRGCPFQAWSVGEALRIQETLLRETRPAGRRPAIRRESPGRAPHP